MVPLFSESVCTIIDFSLFHVLKSCGKYISHVVCYYYVLDTLAVLHNAIINSRTFLSLQINTLAL